MAGIPGGSIPKARPTFWGVVWDWVETLVLCVIIAFAIRAYVLESFTIDGSCMEPDLYTGQRVFVLKLPYRFTEPKRGDVIVFRYPLNPQKDYIKRLIGLPGETISIVNGVVYVNGKELDQSSWPVTMDTVRYPDIPEQTLPPGQFFVLGDNRPESEDSRVWGLVPKANIKGKAFLRYWPVWSLKWLG